MLRSNIPTVLWSIAFCFGHLGIPAFAQWVYDDNGCRTPDRGTGNCVSLYDCSPMITVLGSLQRPISKEIGKRIQAYSCGYDNNKNVVKVCCPPGPINLEPPKVHEFSNAEPPDVSSHKNLYLLPRNCGILKDQDRIVNGKNAILNEFPWMALLRFTGSAGLGFNCGGTIINKNYILTAGHCITALSTSQLVSVRVGEYSIQNQTDCVKINRKTNALKCNPPVQDLRIEEIIPHPQFGSRSFLNDIGLLRVSTMNLNVENVRPVCLPLGKERTKTFSTVIVTGWGVTITGNQSDILQKVSLPIADKTTCTRTYKNHNLNLIKSQICAGGVQNKDSCPGDSGGPMMVPTINDDYEPVYVQHGIVSFGPRFCGIVGYPGVYTLVSYYMDWILDNMKP